MSEDKNPMKGLFTDLFTGIADEQRHANETTGIYRDALNVIVHLESVEKMREIAQKALDTVEEKRAIRHEKSIQRMQSI